MHLHQRPGIKREPPRRYNLYEEGDHSAAGTVSGNRKNDARLLKRRRRDTNDDIPEDKRTWTVTNRDFSSQLHDPQKGETSLDA